MKRRIVFIGFLLFCAGCASIDVSYNFDPAANFATMRTYNFSRSSEEKGSNELTIKQIEDAVNKQLQAKGVIQSSEKPDMLVSIDTKKVSRVENEAWAYQYGGYDLTEYRQGVDTYQYDIRTVILSFTDVNSNTLIWRATASAIVDPVKQAEQIHEIVAKLLENFPPHK